MVRIKLWRAPEESRLGRPLTKGNGGAVDGIETGAGRSQSFAQGLSPRGS